MNDPLIARINELTALSRRRELTPVEQQERQQLRNEYRRRTRENLKAQLRQVKLEK